MKLNSYPGPAVGRWVSYRAANGMMRYGIVEYVSYNGLTVRIHLKDSRVKHISRVSVGIDYCTFHKDRPKKIAERSDVPKPLPKQS